MRYTEREAFLDRVQNWFRERQLFWSLITVFTFSSLVSLQLFFIIEGPLNPMIREGMDAVLVPLLLLFVFSIFWRGSIPAFLSLAGSTSLYSGMFYVYAKAAETQVTGLPIHKPYVTERFLENISLASYGNFYFCLGIFALSLATVIAFRPAFFRAKGVKTDIGYPFWPKGFDGESWFSKRPATLVPVMGLLSDEERYLVKNYKYIQVRIRGRIYLASPHEWVPEGSNVVRDNATGSMSGIPKVPDGFSVG